MHLEWIMTPLSFYGGLALTLIACLALAATFKVEVGEVRHGAEESRKQLAAQLQEVEAALSRLRENPDERGERPSPVSPGLNLTRRAQALRMCRRGESLETIAAALRAPRNEIKLLLKVQGMLQQRNG